MMLCCRISLHCYVWGERSGKRLLALDRETHRQSVLYIHAGRSRCDWNNASSTVNFLSIRFYYGPCEVAVEFNYDV